MARLSEPVPEKEVFPAFAVEMPVLTKDRYTLDEFIEMVRANKSLRAVRVEKQHFGYMVNDFENINYLQVVKRVIGLIDKPFAPTCFRPHFSIKKSIQSDIQ